MRDTIAALLLASALGFASWAAWPVIAEWYERDKQAQRERKWRM